MLNLSVTQLDNEEFTEQNLANVTDFKLLRSNGMEEDLISKLLIGGRS